mmetsp:Transcript_9409/g.23170  ORF Transcript_9409/g.23170 Transcript_9409/m.23170 type:complete len:207 (-) Transcript_9409:1414-2034(-)
MLTGLSNDKESLSFFRSSGVIWRSFSNELYRSCASGGLRDDRGVSAANKDKSKYSATSLLLIKSGLIKQSTEANESPPDEFEATMKSNHSQLLGSCSQTGPDATCAAPFARCIVTVWASRSSLTLSTFLLSAISSFTFCSCSFRASSARSRSDFMIASFSLPSARGAMNPSGTNPLSFFIDFAAVAKQYSHIEHAHAAELSFPFVS